VRSEGFKKTVLRGISLLVRNVMYGRTVAEFYTRGAVPSSQWSNAHVQRSVIGIAARYGLNSSGFESR